MPVKQLCNPEHSRLDRARGVWAIARATQTCGRGDRCGATGDRARPGGAPPPRPLRSPSQSCRAAAKRHVGAQRGFSDLKYRNSEKCILYSQK